MICQWCKANYASVRVTQKLKGQVIQAHLCEKCASEKATMLEPSINIHDFLAGFVDIENRKNIVNSLVCPRCNTTFFEIQKNGKIGCMECYETFSKKLEPIINNIHGNVHFQGRRPRNEISTEELVESTNEEEIAKLKEILKEAVVAENYELAAKIRDEIKRLNK